MAIKRIVKTIVIMLCAVLVLTVGCTGNGGTGQGSEADNIYIGENIRPCIMEGSEHALGLIDTDQQLLAGSTPEVGLNTSGSIDAGSVDARGGSYWDDDEY